MTMQMRAIIAAVGLVVALYSGALKYEDLGLPEMPSLGGIVKTVIKSNVSVPEPVQKVKDAVKKLVELAKAMTPKDRVLLSQFYMDLAASTDKTGTVLEFRNVNTRAGKNFFTQFGLKDKYTGLPEAIEASLDASGMSKVPTDAVDKAAVRQHLEGIAWAFQQG